MSTGIGRACTRSLKGHVISRGLDLVVVVGDAEKKNFPNSFKFVCLKTFLLSMMGRGDH